jgi:exodeoxyribonuclease V alpha subunit
MVQLTAEQQSAVDMVTGDDPPRVACLTGLPGTGKTTAIGAIVSALHGKTVRLCAPSGKAAKRINESTGHETFTVHRLLGLNPRQKEPNPLHAHMVIVDEASMVDVGLMDSLVQACFHGGGEVRTLLLVGDPEQLPPVGPGQPFLDMLHSESTPTVRLTEPQRQALNSGVIRAAYAIHNGEAPQWASDFQLIEVEDADDIPERIWDLLLEHSCEVSDVQILAPQRRGAAGVNALNAFLDRRTWTTCRPGEYEASLVRGFRVGTKVIHTKNDYQLVAHGTEGITEGVMNGECGIVVAARRGEGRDGKPVERRDQILVELDDGRGVVTYKGAAIKMLQQSWAMTVHKSQGSEWPGVVMIAHPSHQFMLSRSLFYVGVTRAMRNVWVVGTQAAVSRAVRNVKDVTRNTNLAHMFAAASEEK